MLEETGYDISDKVDPNVFIGKNNLFCLQRVIRKGSFSRLCVGPFVRIVLDFEMIFCIFDINIDSTNIHSILVNIRMSV